MSKLRFRIAEGDTITLSPWVAEQVGHGAAATATTELAKLRQQHPHAAISIERDRVIPITKPVMVRFKIDVGEDIFYYSKSVPESEEASLREQIENDEVLKEFKKKTLTKEVTNG